MSGWIQLEKDLREDVRVQRMARAIIARGDVTAMRHKVRAAVSLVLGGLAQLWMHADAFAREDDTLEITVDEIDELAGIEGFAQLLPPDWLKVLDAQRVELPGFQAHNGTTAKSRALTNRRTARWRARKSDAERSHSVSERDADPSPDQTRPYHTRPGRESARTARGRANAARLPDDWSLTPERRGIAVAEGINPERTHAKFCDHWRAASGATARKRDWDAAWRNWCRTEADRARGPQPIGRPQGPTAEDAERESLRKLIARRSALGLHDFREPHAGETAEQYRLAQEAEYKRLERERVERDRPIRPAESRAPDASAPRSLNSIVTPLTAAKKVPA